MPIRRRRTWPLVAVAALLMAGCQSAAERSAAAQAQAQQLAAAGQYAAAQAQFDLAVSLRDDLPELWLQRARNQIALSDFAGAFTSYRNVLDQDRTNREALDALAQLALASNRLDDARDYADQILALAPDDPTGLLVQGVIAFRSGRYEAAADIVDRLAKLAPDNERALVLRARLLNRRGQTEDAIAIIKPVFEAQGGTDELRVLLSELYADRANARGLLAIARRDAADRPRDGTVQTVLGERLVAVGDLAAGLAAFDLAHTIAPGSEQRDATGRALADADVAPAAIAAALSGLSAPQADLALAIAQYALARGDAPTATAVLIAMRNVGGNVAVVRTGALALALALQGQMARARDLAAQALTGDADEPYALLARALVEQAARNLDDALRDARTAASGNNQFALGQAVLARILTARGDRILADKAVFDANNADKADPIALRQLAAMLVARDRAADALVYARRFTIDNRASIAGWNLRNQLCARTGDTACVSRSAAIVARLRGGDGPLPPTPIDELPGERDYRDIYRGSDKKAST